MTRDLLEQYEKVLERLETQSWATKEMVFDVLNIDSKEEITKLLEMSPTDMKEYLTKSIQSNKKRKGDKSFRCL